MSALGVRELVTHHHGQSFRTQQAHAVHRAIAEEQPRKLQIIVDRRPKSGTAALIRHILRPLGHNYLAPRATPCDAFRQPALFVKTVCGGPAMALLGTDDEAGVAHAQRAEDAPLEKRSERAAFDSRD